MSMNHPRPLPSYDDLADLLLKREALYSPSALQGLLAGIAAGGGMPSREQRQELLVSLLDLPTDDEGIEALADLLWEQACQGLGDTAMNYALLLPEDDVEIAVRIAALSEWCEAALNGLAMSLPPARAQSLDEEVREMLSDLAAIAQLDENSAQDDGEQDFETIAEYARMLLIQLFLEFNTPTAPKKTAEQPATGSSPASLFQRPNRLH